MTSSWPLSLQLVPSPVLAVSLGTLRSFLPLRDCTAPNLALQRAGTHKVLGRGRLGVVLEQVMRARVLIGRRAVAELGS